MSIWKNLLILASPCLLLACDSSSLDEDKARAINELKRTNPDSLKNSNIELVELFPITESTGRIDVEGGNFQLPEPTGVTNKDRGWILDYPKFKAHIIKSAGGNDFSDLPDSWGKDDLAKTILISAASIDLINAATSDDELADAVALITAKEVAAPIGCATRMMLLQGNTGEALISGDFDEDRWMELLFRPSGISTTNYRIQFEHKPGARHEDVVKFVRALKFHAEET